MLYLPDDPLVIQWQEQMESLKIRPKGWFLKKLEMWSLQPGFASGIQKFPNSHRILTRYARLPNLSFNGPTPVSWFYENTLPMIQEQLEWISGPAFISREEGHLLKKTQRLLKSVGIEMYYQSKKYETAPGSWQYILSTEETCIL